MDRGVEAAGRCPHARATVAFRGTSRTGAELWIATHPGVARRLQLPSDVKAEVRERLDFYGITERIFFPGPEGLAAFLARYYRERSVEAVRSE